MRVHIGGLDALPPITMHLEEAEVLAIMWAIEVATEPSPREYDEKEEGDVGDDAYAVHQRLQAAWQESRVAKP